MKKILALVLILGIMLALSAPAMAYYASWEGSVWKNVYGGASQNLAYNVVREQPVRIDLYIISLDWRGQSQFRIRGYVGTGSTTCTPLTDITSYGSNLAAYTATNVGDRVTVKQSIASSNSSDYMRFQGRLYV